MTRGPHSFYIRSELWVGRRPTQRHARCRPGARQRARPRGQTADVHLQQCVFSSIFTLSYHVLFTSAPRHVVERLHGARRSSARALSRIRANDVDRCANVGHVEATRTPARTWKRHRFISDTSQTASPEHPPNVGREGAAGRRRSSLCPAAPLRDVGSVLRSVPARSATAVAASTHDIAGSWLS